MWASQHLSNTKQTKIREWRQSGGCGFRDRSRILCAGGYGEGAGFLFQLKWENIRGFRQRCDMMWFVLKDHHGSCIVNEEGKVREIQAQIYYFVLDYNVSHRTSTLVSWLQFSLSFYPVTSSSSIYFPIILSSRHDLPSYLLWWFYQLLNYLSIYSSHGLTLLGYRNMSYYLY